MDVTDTTDALEQQQKPEKYNTSRIKSVTSELAVISWIGLVSYSNLLLPCSPALSSQGACPRAAASRLHACHRCQVRGWSLTVDLWSSLCLCLLYRGFIYFWWSGWARIIEGTYWLKGKHCSARIAGRNFENSWVFALIDLKESDGLGDGNICQLVSTCYLLALYFSIEALLNVGVWGSRNWNRIGGWKYDNGWLQTTVNGRSSPWRTAKQGQKDVKESRGERRRRKEGREESKVRQTLLTLGCTPVNSLSNRSQIRRKI